MSTPPNHDGSSPAEGGPQAPYGAAPQPPGSQAPYGSAPQPPYGGASQPGQGAGPGAGAPHYGTPPGAMPPPQESYGQYPMGGGAGQPADVMTRFLAKLIDMVALWIVFTIVGFFLIAGAIFGGGDGGFGVANVLNAILSAAIFLAYFSLMEAKLGKTLGKMLMKLEVRGAGGGLPTLEEAVKRNAWTALGIVSIIPFLGWLLSGALQLAATIAIAVTISNDTVRRQGWHDRFAGGTTVVKTA